MKFVRKCPINNIPALFQILAWHRPDDKPLSEAIMIWSPTHTCVTRPQLVNHYHDPRRFVHICTIGVPFLVENRWVFILLNDLPVHWRQYAQWNETNKISVSVKNLNFKPIHEWHFLLTQGSRWILQAGQMDGKLVSTHRQSTFLSVWFWHFSMKLDFMVTFVAWAWRLLESPTTRLFDQQAPVPLNIELTNSIEFKICWKFLCP